MMRGGRGVPLFPIMAYLALSLNQTLPPSHPPQHPPPKRNSPRENDHSPQAAGAVLC